jgi:type IV secretion system protein VirB10
MEPSAPDHLALSRTDGLMVDLPAPAVSASNTPHAAVRAERHHASALTLSAGSIISCALETAINSQRPGLVTCVVTEDVVSDDARVTLIERGTHVLGSYRADIHLGDSRVNVVWDRLRKADGTTVDLESPGVDAEGSSGLSGLTDNHWFDRIGAAVLLSLIQDSVADLTQPKANGSAVIFANTANAGPALSQKVLDATINIAPTITVAAGARINILVARDIDFSGVYGAH